MLDCIDRFGSLEAIAPEAEENAADSVRNIVWLIAQMSKAGEQYNALSGQTAAEPLSEDEILVFCGKDDFPMLKDALGAAIMAGSSRDVEVAGKNAETTRPA